MLIQRLGEISEFLSEDQAEHTYSVLSSTIDEIRDAWEGEDEERRLSRTFDGSLADVYGEALETLAKLTLRDAQTYVNQFDETLQIALTSTNADIRRSAFAAAKTIQELSPASLMGVLFGTRDPDHHAAQWAFAVLAEKRSLVNDLNLWHAFIFTATGTLQSEHASLRRVAAWALAELQDKSPNSIIWNRIDTLLKEHVVNDISYSVRQTINNFQKEQPGT